MQKSKSILLQIPENLDYSALELTRDPVTLDISFNWRPIEAICRLSGIDTALLLDMPEDNLSTLLHLWYLEHLSCGGAPDPVEEQLRAEVEAEKFAGGQVGVISHGGVLH